MISREKNAKGDRISDATAHPQRCHRAAWLGLNPDSVKSERLLFPTLKGATNDARVRLLIIVQNVFRSIAGAYEFITLLRDREIQREEGGLVTNVIAAGEEPQVACAALTVLTQRVAAELDLRKG